MLVMKECNKCGMLKDVDCFSGKSKVCKPCIVIRNRDYYRTKEGRIKLMLSALSRKSLDRNHPPMITSLEEFTNWVTHNGFDLLYDNWVQAYYNKNLLPSVDRLDSTKPYHYENMRMVTWEANNNAAYKERKAGKRVTRQNRQINQLSVAGEVVGRYSSIALAARELGFCRTNINSCLKGKREVAHGFRWEYQSNQLHNVPTNRDVLIKRKEK